MDDKIRIELTEEQKNQLREATGKEASAIELTAEEQSQLTEAIAQAERGEGIDGWRLLEELKG